MPKLGRMGSFHWFYRDGLRFPVSGCCHCYVVPGAWGNQGAQGVLFDSTTNITIEALLEDYDSEPRCSALQ